MTKAIVLAAGFGTRMRPLTDTLPKPLLKVAGVTLIDRALDWLYASGINDVVVNSFYKAEILEAHLARRRTPKIHTSRETTILETGGGIKNALPLLGEKPFFSVNADVICLDGKTPALKRLLDAWDDKTMDALLLVHPVEKAVGYDEAGDFFLEPNGSLRWRMDAKKAPYVFTGVQLIHPRLFNGAPEGAFSTKLMWNRGMLANGTLPRIHGLPHDGNWLHVGDPDGLKQAADWLGTVS